MRLFVALVVAAIAYFVLDIAPFVPSIIARDIQVQQAVAACMSWDLAPPPDIYANCRTEDITRVIPGGFDN